MKHMTNEEILKEAQAKIIVRGDNPYYPPEQHLIDMDLLADLTALCIKYADKSEVQKNDKDNRDKNTIPKSNRGEDK